MALNFTRCGAETRGSIFKSIPGLKLKMIFWSTQDLLGIITPYLVLVDNSKVVSHTASCIATTTKKYLLQENIMKLKRKLNLVSSIPRPHVKVVSCSHVLDSDQLTPKPVTFYRNKFKVFSMMSNRLQSHPYLNALTHSTFRDVYNLQSTQGS